jgi:hypothetical protein
MANYSKQSWSAAHLAISAEGIAPLKRDDCNLPDGSRVDVEKSTRGQSQQAIIN